MPSIDELPYRRCVGAMVLNKAGLVFVGHRSPRRSGVTHTDATHVWQMPQGGIDHGENPWPAALRELYEETSIRSVERLGEVGDWLSYDIPRDLLLETWGGKYRGQTQKWFALRFTGDDSEIDVLSPGGGAHPAEFTAWKWEPMANLPDLVVPFKRPIYERVVKEFAEFAASDGR
jgi:putative (di)nucleoside polyphosphate hydrolase